MDDWKYLLVIAAGAIMVLHKAYSQFESPLDVDKDQRYTVLNDVEIRSLTSDSVFRFGRWVYVAIFIIVYVLGLQVWDVVESLTDKNPTAVESGPQGALALEEEGFWLDREGYGRPIYIASALISLLTVGALASYERSLRAFAHRQAGIPDNIYRVTGRLSRAPYADIVGALPSRRQRRFDQRLAGGLEQLPETDRGAIEGPVEQIRADLGAIDLLTPPVLGDEFGKTFQLDKVKVLDALRDVQRTEMQAIDAEIGALVIEGDGLDKFASRVDRAKNNLQALFAVLYLKDSASKFEDAGPATRKIIDHVRNRAPDYAVSSITLAVLATLLAGIFIAFFVGFHFYAVAAGVTCEGLLNCDRSHLAFVGDRSIRIYLEAAAVFAAAAAFTTYRRRTMIEMRVWEDWPFRQPPVPRLVRSAMVPALLSVAAIGIVLYLETVYDLFEPGSSALPRVDLGDLIAGNAAFLLLAALAGFFTSLSVTVIADKHDALSLPAVVAVAFGFASLIFLVALVVLVVNHGFDWGKALRDALDYLLLALVFLVTFAASIDLSEHADTEAQP